MFLRSSLCSRSSLSCVFALCLTSHLYALDESRLWLPSNYERLYLDLVDAAKQAESLKRCQKVLRGTLDLKLSKKDHPIFRIQCRQANGYSYNEMVDGLSFETLTTQEKIEGLTDEQLRVIHSERLSLCKDKLHVKTKLFSDRRFLDDKPQPASFSMTESKYYIDFDAKNASGEDLRYRAICIVGDSKVAQVHIRKRR